MTFLFFVILSGTFLLDLCFYLFALRKKPHVKTREERLLLHKEYDDTRRWGVDAMRGIVKAALLILVITLLFSRALMAGQGRESGGFLLLSWGFFVLAILTGLSTFVFDFLGHLFFSHGETHGLAGEDDGATDQYIYSERAFDTAMVFGFTALQFLIWGVIFLFVFGVGRL